MYLEVHGFSILCECGQEGFDLKIGLPKVRVLQENMMGASLTFELHACILTWLLGRPDN